MGAGTQVVLWPAGHVVWWRIGRVTVAVMFVLVAGLGVWVGDGLLSGLVVALIGSLLLLALFWGMFGYDRIVLDGDELRVYEGLSRTRVLHRADLASLDVTGQDAFFRSARLVDSSGHVVPTSVLVNADLVFSAAGAARRTFDSNVRTLQAWMAQSAG
jgi:hypothetical protein